MPEGEGSADRAQEALTEQKEREWSEKSATGTEIKRQLHIQAVTKVEYEIHMNNAFTTIENAIDKQKRNASSTIMST